MKKILFAIAIVLTISLTVNAQGRDSFFSEWSNDRGYVEDQGLGLPGASMITGGQFGNDQDAPLGSGLLILTALGAGYAVARKKRK